MLHRLRTRVTYANVVSSLALFIALGGVSYAAITLPASSVGTRQLKNHAVTLVKISSGARSALHGQQGQQGRQGQQGPPGAPGAPGTARAYGQVAATGTLTVSKGSPTVTHPGAGFYCIAVPGVDPPTTRVSVSLGGGAVDANAAPPTEEAGGSVGGDPCPSGTFEVINGTLVYSGGAIGFNYNDEPFFFEIP